MTDNLPTEADSFESVERDDVSLARAPLGYNIRVAGETAGSIEGVPGQLDHIAVEPHWQDKGVARNALRAFIDLSRQAGCDRVVTNNAVHPAMTHILETEGFAEQDGGQSWSKTI